MTILELDNYESFGTPGSGNQVKFWVNNQLIKLDSKFKESDKEVSASKLADIFEINHVDYFKVKSIYKNNVYNSCLCNSYLNSEIEEEISVFNILTLFNVNITNNESSISYFNKVVYCINKFTGIDEKEIKHWLMVILTFDYLICNTDRHLSNINVIHNFITNSYSLSPIYDCGQSFLGTNGDLTLKEIENRSRKLKFRPFSTNEKSNLVDITYAKELLSKWETMAINKYGSLINIPINTGHNKIFRYRVNKLKSL